MLAHHNMKSDRLSLVAVIAAALVGACTHSPSMTSPNHAASSNRMIEVDAALAGYQTFREFPSGEEVVSFAFSTSQVPARVRGFLFCVSTTNYPRCYFYMHHDGDFAYDFFRADRRYRFKIPKSALRSFNEDLCAGDDRYFVGTVGPTRAEMNEHVHELEVRLRGLQKYIGLIEEKMSKERDEAQRAVLKMRRSEIEQDMAAISAAIVKAGQDECVDPSIITTNRQPAAGDYRLEDKAKSQR